MYRTPRETIFLMTSRYLLLINLNSHNQQMCMETIRTSVLNLLSEQVTNPHLVSHINEKMRYNRIKRND
jgi:hypothetical protein